jgi:hypothetical protein
VEHQLVGQGGQGVEMGEERRLPLVGQQAGDVGGDPADADDFPRFVMHWKIPDMQPAQAVAGALDAKPDVQAALSMLARLGENALPVIRMHVG